MKSVASMNELVFTKDVKLLLRTSSPESISNYLMNHMNKT